jgi:hypothetical protein
MSTILPELNNHSSTQAHSIVVPKNVGLCEPGNTFIYVLRQRHYYFSPGADPKFDPGGRGVDPDAV